MHNTAGIEFSVEMLLDVDNRRFLGILNRQFRFARALAVDHQARYSHVRTFAPSGSHVMTFLVDRSRVSCATSSASTRSPSRYHASDTTEER